MVALKEPVATEFATVIYATLMLKQRLCDQGCGVGGKISDSDFPKFPTPTLQNVRLPATTFQKFQAPDSTENEIWLLKSMEIVVRSKKPLFQKKLYHFNRNP